MRPFFDPSQAVPLASLPPAFHRRLLHSFHWREKIGLAPEGWAADLAWTGDLRILDAGVTGRASALAGLLFELGVTDTRFVGEVLLKMEITPTWAAHRLSPIEPDPGSPVLLDLSLAPAGFDDFAIVMPFGEFVARFGPSLQGITAAPADLSWMLSTEQGRPTLAFRPRFDRVRRLLLTAECPDVRGTHHRPTVIVGFDDGSHVARVLRKQHSEEAALALLGALSDRAGVPVERPHAPPPEYRPRPPAEVPVPPLAMPDEAVPASDVPPIAEQLAAHFPTPERGHREALDWAGSLRVIDPGCVSRLQLLEDMRHQFPADQVLWYETDPPPPENRLAAILRAFEPDLSRPVLMLLGEHPVYGIHRRAHTLYTDWRFVTEYLRNVPSHTTVAPLTLDWVLSLEGCDDTAIIRRPRFESIRRITRAAAFAPEPGRDIPHPVFALQFDRADPWVTPALSTPASLHAAASLMHHLAARAHLPIHETDLLTTASLLTTPDDT